MEYKIRHETNCFLKEVAISLSQAATLHILQIKALHFSVNLKLGSKSSNTAASMCSDFS